MGWLDKLLGKTRANESRHSGKGTSSDAAPDSAGPAALGHAEAKLRAVPGALVASSGGEVIYNLLDPHMQQFMGRCVGILKKAGLRATGTGQFSVRLEDRAELKLDLFYERYNDPSVFDDLVAAAKNALSAERNA